LYADYVGGVVVRHTSFFYFQLACCLFWHRNMQYVNTLHTVEYWNFVKTQNLLIIMINHFLKLSSKSKILISNKNIYKLSFCVCMCYVLRWIWCLWCLYTRSMHPHRASWKVCLTTKPYCYAVCFLTSQYTIQLLYKIQFSHNETELFMMLYIWG
jgi:hypothetical protein